ncbi:MULTISPECIES: DUF1835 domain-containing protein [Thalassospira]|uniref:DUF1835 domain-containing protein n=1 Tax=Thalassospira TaxID=168934 RepID=UPI0008DD3132|nr:MULTISPECIES: DUF1835 domain-containing protein [Thalassospira]MAB33229.1 DUF1835 domain-containing protein [Thalassospira sp.]MDM7976974.1 DUF1835 domain-containing protein [Thalassospira xiamenensis]OHY99333.1 hypothetical protein BC440_02370 [Thalassospira sp. MIT1004]HBS21870.1 DUF1835 domain-containing protein [Thalassospira sp.]
MSASRTSKSGIFDGRLNLEQQRKRAKELLKSARAQQGDAQTRISIHLPGKSIEDLQLADSQLVIARENGFASWPKLKSHIDRITEHQRQIASGHLPTLDTAQTLHLRCGSDISHCLKLAGFAGAFMEFSDPFCQGPVPDVPLPDFIETRARFIASSYRIDFPDALSRLQREYAGLATLGDYDHVVLWFEHDSYDQLILVFLLDFIANLRPQTRLDLICVDRVPGVERFIGLGQLSPELLIWCWENARAPVSDAMLECGQTVWPAIRASKPDALRAIIDNGQSPIPCMIAALDRHLRELPDPGNGLGLTQELTLQILADFGPLPAGKVFGHLMLSYEPLPFLGDLMFREILADMKQTSSPLFDFADNQPHTPWPEQILSLTETGHEILSGTRNFMELYTGERWVGGIRITGAAVG